MIREKTEKERRLWDILARAPSLARPSRLSACLGVLVSCNIKWKTKFVTHSVVPKFTLLIKRVRDDYIFIGFFALWFQEIALDSTQMKLGSFWTYRYRRSFIDRGTQILEAKSPYFWASLICLLSKWPFCSPSFADANGLILKPLCQRVSEICRFKENAPRRCVGVGKRRFDVM